MKKAMRLLMALGILLGLGSTVVFSQWDDSEKKALKLDEGQLEKAEKVRAENESRLLAVPGVVGVGVGATEEGDRPAIHVFVDLRAAGGKIPASIPKQIDNVPVRVIVTDEIKAR
jgi:hypothetical protein